MCSLITPTTRAFVRGSHGIPKALENFSTFSVVTEQRNAVERACAARISTERDGQPPADSLTGRCRRRAEMRMREAQPMRGEQLVSARFRIEFGEDVVDESLIGDDATAFMTAVGARNERNRRKCVSQRENCFGAPRIGFGLVNRNDPGSICVLASQSPGRSRVRLLLSARVRPRCADAEPDAARPHAL